MNTRQRSLINLLLKNKETLTIDEIATELKCSEKTIRNDFKEIDEWLSKNFEAKIIRKPNLGVKLEITEEEKKKILSNTTNVSMSFEVHTNEGERKIEILSLLLKDNKIPSIQSLSEAFYVSKNVIKKDINEICFWLTRYGLSIESKQKKGLRIIGDEIHKRSALSNINEFSENVKSYNLFEKWFSPYEKTKTKQQIKKIETELNKQFTLESIENLVRHVLITIKRVKQKQNIRIPAIEMNKLKTTKEYDVVKKQLAEIEKTLVLKFPDEEIAYITSHIISAKEKTRSSSNENDYQSEVYSFIVDMIQNMSQYTNIEHFKDEHLLHGLYFHMKSVIQRIKFGLSYKNPLLKEIKKNYPYTFASIYNVTKDVEGKIGFAIPEDEIGYLTLHFEASKERLKKTDGENKRAIIVCSMGIGMSQLLLTKIERKFHSLNILNCISVDDLEETLENESPDFIISTIPLKTINFPVIYLSPLLQKEEEKKLEEFISSFGKLKTMSFPTIKKFLNEELVLFDIDVKEPESIVALLSNLLKEKGYVNNEYLHDVLEREKMSPTTIGGEISIPHGNPRNVLKEGIALAKLKNPISWNGEFVSFVFMLSFKDSKNEDVKKLFQEISTLSEEIEIIEKWKNGKTKIDFYNQI